MGMCGVVYAAAKMSGDKSAENYGCCKSPSTKKAVDTVLERYAAQIEQHKAERASAAPGRQTMPGAKKSIKASAAKEAASVAKPSRKTSVAQGAVSKESA